MASNLNSDLIVWIITGVVLGATTILTSSYFYPSKNAGSASSGDGASKKNIFEDIPYREYDCSSSKILDPSELDPIVVDKLCENLAKRVPEGISVSNSEIKKAVIESLVNPESLDEINFADIVGWVVFLAFIGIAYYLINNETRGDFHQILRGLFPREYKVFGL